MVDPPDIPTGATSNGILLCCVTAAIGKVELVGWPDYAEGEDEEF